MKFINKSILSVLLVTATSVAAHKKITKNVTKSSGLSTATFDVNENPIEEEMDYCYGYTCCDTCNVYYYDRKGIYGYEKNDWCGIKQQCKITLDENCWSSFYGYACCEGCIVWAKDENGMWGRENGNWCGIDKEKCEAKSSTLVTVATSEVPLTITATTSKKATTTSAPEETTNAAEATNAAEPTTKTKKTTTKTKITTKTKTTTIVSTESPKECYGYPCCKRCDVYTVTRTGRWGIENNAWCGIDESKCEYKEDDSCIASMYGYPCCEKCTVRYTDDLGEWGVEKGAWCGIKYSCKDGEVQNSTEQTAKVEPEPEPTSTELETTIESTTEVATTTNASPLETEAVEEECWSKAQGYDCCTNTCRVRYIDISGEWGVENNNWCGIVERKCRGRKDKSDVINGWNWRNNNSRKTTTKAKNTTITKTEAAATTAKTEAAATTTKAKETTTTTVKSKFLGVF